MDLGRVRLVPLITAAVAAFAVVAGITDWISHEDAGLLLGGSIVLAILAIREV